MALTINHQTNDISATSGSMTIDGSAIGGGGGAWNLISTTTVTSAVNSVDFTSIGSYNRYALLFDYTMNVKETVSIRIYDNGLLVTSSDYAFLRSSMGAPTGVAGTLTSWITREALLQQIGHFEISAVESRLPFTMRSGGTKSSSNDFCDFNWTAGALKSTYSLTSFTGLQLTSSTASNILTGRFSLYGLSQ